MNKEEVLAEVLGVNVKSIDLHKSNTLTVDDALQAMEEYASQSKDAEEFDAEDFLNTKDMDLKANELRIGNYIKFKSTGEVERVYNIINDFRWIGGVSEKNKKSVDINSVDIADAESIPLNEEWLVKFGFEKHFGNNNHLLYSLPNLTLVKYEKETDFNGYWLKYYQGKFPKKLKYVHQLQNLYFALTGEEL